MMDNEEVPPLSPVKQVVRKTLLIENIGVATTVDDLTRCFAPALQKCGKDRPPIQLAVDRKGRSLGYATVTVPLSTVELFLDFNDRYINNDKIRVTLGDKRVGTWQSVGNGVFMSSKARRSTVDTVTCNTMLNHGLIDGGMYLTHKKVKVPDHVVAAALTDGTEKLVSLGKSVFHSQEALKLTRLFSGTVYCTTGVSPQNAVFWTDETSHQLEEVAKSPGCVAIGPCGYDLSTDKMVDTAVQQLQAFEAQIQLAIRLNMPLVVCETMAKSEVMSLLTSYKDKLPRVAILTKPASLDVITDYLDHGFYFFVHGHLWLPGSSSPVWIWLKNCTPEQLTRVVVSSQMPTSGCPTRMSVLCDIIIQALEKDEGDVRGILRDNTVRFYGLSDRETDGVTEDGGSNVVAAEVGSHGEEEGGISIDSSLVHPTVSCEVAESDSVQVSADVKVVPADDECECLGDVHSTSSLVGEEDRSVEDRYSDHETGHLVSDEADVSSSKVGTKAQHDEGQADVSSSKVRTKAQHDEGQTDVSCSSVGSNISVPEVCSQKDRDGTVNVETNWTYRILLWLAFISGLTAMYFYGN
ncbi:uncharacterized protein LOC124257487 isoform X2 [Haliotis rubra]|uniref:uncharacterized protein LOC124257487 isoform X2 n=1 Tax=Haliotis rubra TaxID=36100 RepID=UPI001EE54873|nr:uncharacterized protein LOC124257487 isoform X2 [Haliotis rubra]